MIKNNTLFSWSAADWMIEQIKEGKRGYVNSLCLLAGFLMNHVCFRLREHVSYSVARHLPRPRSHCHHHCFLFSFITSPIFPVYTKYLVLHCNVLLTHFHKLTNLLFLLGSTIPVTLTGFLYTVKFLSKSERFRLFFIQSYPLGSRNFLWCSIGLKSMELRGRQTQL